MKVFPVRTVEPAKRFTKLTTTDVPAKETSVVKIARTVSCFSVSVTFSFIVLNFKKSGSTPCHQRWRNGRSHHTDDTKLDILRVHQNPSNMYVVVVYCFHSILHLKA